jgi:hypothetical protein
MLSRKVAYDLFGSEHVLVTIDRPGWLRHRSGMALTSQLGPRQSRFSLLRLLVAKEGRKIAFRIGSDHSIPEVLLIQNIYTINIDGSNLIKLTNENDNPQWDKISREPSW